MTQDKNQKLKKFRIRIVNKSKDGLVLDFKEAGGLQKVTWEEFTKSHQICKDNPKYAEPTDELQKQIEEVNDKLNDAVVYFIMSGGLARMKGKDPEVPIEEFKYTLGFGSIIDELEKTTGMTVAQIISLIRQRIDDLQTLEETEKHVKKSSKENRRNFKERSKERYNEREREKHQQMSFDSHSECILADNPQLIELKKQLETQK